MGEPTLRREFIEVKAVLVDIGQLFDTGSASVFVIGKGRIHKLNPTPAPCMELGLSNV